VRLPDTVVISRDKLLRNLLLSREENDKSKFLSLAGYTLANVETLEKDLRALSKTQEINASQNSEYGIKYEVRGVLTGPNGRWLHIMTVWIKLEVTGEVRFVTLYSDKPDKNVTIL
jgi:hypothetical protein